MNNNIKNLVRETNPLDISSIAFNAANYFNFSRAENSFASGLTKDNLLYNLVLLSAKRVIKNLPEESYAGRFFTGLENVANSNRFFRFIASQITNPLRVTAYFTVGTGIALLGIAVTGSSFAVLPAIAALSFGLGNFLQSSQFIQNLRADETTNPALKALTHSAIWYGVGYTATGLSIGGGLSMLTAPMQNPTATVMTGVGVTEIIGSLGFLISGKVTNQASPSYGVAIGTLFIAAAGMAKAALTGDVSDLKGVATGLFACIGEVAVGAFLQQLHNASPNASQLGNGVERALSAPVRSAMDRNWINPTPLSA